MNLTAITEYNDFVIKHFADSLAVVNAMTLQAGMKIIDIGTGAGFPGIVLKTVFPQCKYTLLDSLNKRINFLNEVVDKLELDDIRCVHFRAEDFAAVKGEREGYDICVSRAVANLSTLSEYCIPFVKPGGYFIAYKAGDCQEEIDSAAKAIKVLGGIIEKVIEYKLPETDIDRTLVVIKKINNTMKKYPRKAGLPSKEPIS